MQKLLDPLDMNKKEAVRILSDRGIKQAIEYGLIKINPDIDLEDSTRIQPATLDVKIKQIEGAEPIDHQESSFYVPRSGEELTLPARSISTINLTELIDFGQLDSNRLSKPVYLNVMTEARSSIRRLGSYMANSATPAGSYFFSGPDFSQIEIGNFSKNDLHFKKEERIAQLFFRVHPFADYYFTNQEGPEFIAKPLESGELIRSLDMGIEIKDKKQLRLLQKKDFMDLSPELKTEKGLIKVHADKTAYRMKKIKGGIDFNKRKEYSKKELLEAIDISKGYTINPFEHILIKTQEELKLSPHVGIRFWDNFYVKMIEEGINKPYFDKIHKDLSHNSNLTNLTDGWVDPGYKGGFSRQPKWLTGRTIYPGDVVGFGQVFFFPKGVETSYGKKTLGSQYQEK